MAGKKRIHDLAKEYGIPGKELAGKLRDLGVTFVKSHMSALDEFQELQVQGILEAHGMVPIPITSTHEEEPAGVLIRRKKKAKPEVAKDTSVAECAVLFTSQGRMVLAFVSHSAASNVSKFIEHARAGAFDRRVFNRLTSALQICGKPQAGKEGAVFRPESVSNESHFQPGLVSLEVRASESSDDCRFRIWFEGAGPFEDEHAVIAHVVEGEETLAAIEADTRRSEGDWFAPKKTVTLHSVVITEDPDAITKDPREIAESYPPGAVVTGTVTAITENSARIQLEQGVQGQIDSRDLDWGAPISVPAELFTLGEEASFVVLNSPVEKPTTGLVALGQKQLRENPWSLGRSKGLESGQRVSGVFKKTHEGFSYFLIDDGIDGNAGIQAFSLADGLSDLAAGERVLATIVRVDPYEQEVQLEQVERVSLSEDDVPSGSIDSELVELRATMEVLSSQLEDLRSMVSISQQRPEELLAFERSARSSIERATTEASSPLRLEPAESLRASLRDQGVFLALRTVEQIRSLISTRRIVVFEGPPGTGKTQLAEALACIVLGVEEGLPHTTASVRSDWTAKQLFGRKRAIDKRHFGLSPGFMTKALLNCLDSAQGHWLILDEINRGDVKAYMESLLRALAKPANQPCEILQPDLFLGDAETDGVIPVPASFRILGTMNSADELLYSFDDAQRRRIGFVELPPLDGEREKEALMHHSKYDPLLHGESAELTSSVWDSIREPLIEFLMESFGHFRALVEREPRRDYRYCEIGTGYLVSAMGCIQAELSNYRFDPGDLPTFILDRAIANEMDSLFERSPLAPLTDLIEDVLPSLNLPETSSRLRRIIEKRDWA